ncbi:TPA: DUF2767 family protein [Klebsiella oxytoca]|nr:DUF2767 family protein [Klebsiella oxytoca]
MRVSEAFYRQHHEMCQIVGSIVFTRAAAGHDPQGFHLGNGKYPTFCLYFKQVWQAALSDERKLTYLLK